MANERGKSNRLESGNVLVCGHLYRRCESSGAVEPVTNGTVRFLCSESDDEIVARTNDQGAYGAPVATGEYLVSITDDASDSAADQLVVRQSIALEDGPIIRRHHLLHLSGQLSRGRLSIRLF